MSPELLPGSSPPYRGGCHGRITGWSIHSAVMLPIPGTGKVAHLEQNMAAAGIALSADEVEELNALA